MFAELGVPLMEGMPVEKSVAKLLRLVDVFGEKRRDCLHEYNTAGIGQSDDGERTGTEL